MAVLLSGALPSLLLDGTVRTSQIRASTHRSGYDRGRPKSLSRSSLAIDAALPDVWAGAEVEVNTRAFRIITDTKTISVFGICCDGPTGSTAAGKPHRLHIFRDDVADRVAVIIRMRRSIARGRERTQCF